MSKLTVEQADRDAAATLMRETLSAWCEIDEGELVAVAAGSYDDDNDFGPTVQAFARHRLQERERCAAEQWQDIESAPRDGTVIFTNAGTAKFDERLWYLCDTGGVVPACADWGREISEIEPTAWLPAIRTPPETEQVKP